MDKTSFGIKNVGAGIINANHGAQRSANLRVVAQLEKKDLPILGEILEIFPDSEKSNFVRLNLSFDHAPYLQINGKEPQETHPSIIDKIVALLREINVKSTIDRDVNSGRHIELPLEDDYVKSRQCQDNFIPKDSFGICANFVELMKSFHEAKCVAGCTEEFMKAFRRKD